MKTRRFLLTNFLRLIICAAAWRAGLLDWAHTLPHHVWLVLGFMGVVLVGGLCFAVAGRWDVVGHVANTLPTIGLLGTAVSIQGAAGGIASMSPEAAFALFHGIITALPPTACGIAGLLYLREVHFWAVGETL
jgi:hypothetical protein